MYLPHSPAFTVLQAAKALIMDMLSSKGFRKIFRNYETHELHLEAFCEATAECLAEAKEVVEEWAGVDCLTELIMSFDEELDSFAAFLEVCLERCLPA